MAEPFTALRVCRFLLLCLLGLAAVYGLFYLLMHARARKSVTPHMQSRVELPARPVLPPIARV